MRMLWNSTISTTEVRILVWQNKRRMAKLRAADVAHCPWGPKKMSAVGGDEVDVSVVMLALKETEELLLEAARG